jgi:hypothetical protein
VTSFRGSWTQQAVTPCHLRSSDANAGRSGIDIPARGQGRSSDESLWIPITDKAEDNDLTSNSKYGDIALGTDGSRCNFPIMEAFSIYEAALRGEILL